MKDNNGLTALHYAAQKPELLEILIDNGADVPAAEKDAVGLVDRLVNHYCFKIPMENFEQSLVILLSHDATPRLSDTTSVSGAASKQHRKRKRERPTGYKLLLLELEGLETVEHSWRQLRPQFDFYHIRKKIASFILPSTPAGFRQIRKVSITLEMLR